MKRSRITWTDYSGGDLNVVTGCTPVSEGCANCYARAIYERFGLDHSKVMIREDKLQRLSKMRLPQDGNRRGPNSKPMCFICDTGDLFHPDVPEEFISDVFEMMARRQDVIWQVLTKRPDRMREIVTRWGQPMPVHVWLGVTCENQARADERIPLLLQTPAAVRFVSCEPMLEPIDLGKCRMLDWVICGAESGPHRRPFDRAWAANLYAQCAHANVAFFGKQDSDLKPGKPLYIAGEVIHQWPEVTA